MLLKDCLPVCALVVLSALLGCDPTGPTPGTPAQHQTLNLTRDQSGRLDCVAPADCADLPYDGDCVSILLDIDGDTGNVCQTCVLPDGTSIDQGCEDTVVDCVLVTLPDPDCVVCSYVDRTVVWSTCTANPPEECVTYTRPDNTTCQRCYDPTGRVVRDSCLPDCGAVVCPPITCGPGYELARKASDCCPRCVPTGDCDEIVCAQDFGIPDCPGDTSLVRDPTDCCGYVCEPTACLEDASQDAPVSSCDTAAECPSGMACENHVCVHPCPTGSMWVEAFPYCGQCVLQDETRLCQTELDCGAEEYCVFDDGVCMPPPEDGSSGAPDATSCFGVCRPRDPVCPNSSGEDPTLAPPLADCEGVWRVEYDSNGCPQPICVCEDGTVSLDGKCRDFCDEMDCVAAAVPDCLEGFHLEYFLPYCCGICVPDDLCGYEETQSTDPDRGFVYACADVFCAAGYHEEIDPVTCCPHCVRDWEEETPCRSTQECLPGQYCTVEDGECNPPPGCDPASGRQCLAVCYGVCAVPPLYRCQDSDRGITPAVAGTVTHSAGTGPTTMESDTCSDDGQSVIEYYCYQTSDGWRVSHTRVGCTADDVNGTNVGQTCVDGACVSP